MGDMIRDNASGRFGWSGTLVCVGFDGMSFLWNWFIARVVRGIARRVWVILCLVQHFITAVPCNLEWSHDGRARIDVRGVCHRGSERLQL